ncbi:MAG: SUMF1/EgtB/PvdO family nonheme iron enzyme [Nitrospira sp.]|nr:SUMF1/EgtB/PvdO family nonheme iron enzyme [Nitrospira sp.]
MTNFKGNISHTWSPRKLMGLPETYSRSPFGHGITNAVRNLFQKDIANWLKLVENPKQQLIVRLAAGYALALCGDPRISPFEPIMITISTINSVTLGLDHEQLLSTYDKLKSLGVELEWIEKECPSYSINLRPYRIAKYPITNYEFSIFLEDSQYTEIPTSWTLGRYPLEKSNHPVHTISPNAADAYAMWISQKTDRKFRLPTEAEWEFAAAGPDRLEYPWGNEFKDGIINTVELGLLDSSPVGCFPTSDSIFGVSDMAGNVEEYVLNTYAPYPGGKIINDYLYRICPDYRIARGGSFTRFKDLARNRRRHGRNPDSIVYVMGFRLAEEI